MTDEKCERESWFRTFFDRYYDEFWLVGPAGAFVTEQQTAAEVEFILDALKIQPGSRVLDVACGSGRHSRELTRRGYPVTGIDLSRRLLKEAIGAAFQEEVHADWIQMDMRKLSFQQPFSAAICMYTSLGYFACDAEDAQVLRGISKSLVSGGKFLLDTVNRDEVVGHLVPAGWWEADGRFVLERRELDLLEGRLNTLGTIVDELGREEFYTSVRLYTLPELCTMMDDADLVLAGLWGDFDGSLFCRDSPRLILLGERR